MSKIVPFNFEKHAIRVVTDDGGEPLFVGKDICKALGYKDATTAIRSHCKGVQKLLPLQTGGGMQEVRVLSEPDVMRLIVNSTLPAAERFERLVFEVILPSVRKTGSYLAPGAALEALAPALATQIGGIIKSVVHKQLADILQDELPRLLQGELAKQRTSMRYGQTAGQIWKAHGLGALKNGSQFLSRCLVRLGCTSIGCAELGGLKSKMFDPDKAATAMKTGLLEHCKKYVQERGGQGGLFVVNGRGR
jgi:prophage antirepressor-like protein